MTTAHTIILCEEKFKSIFTMIPIVEYNRRISEIDHLANDPKLWSNPNKGASLMKERQKISGLVTKIEYFKGEVQFYLECLNVIPHEVGDYKDNVDFLYKELSDFEFRQMFSDPVDDTPAILSINSGAGGLEAANWVTMMLRMYVRYADSCGFKVEILDEKKSEEHSNECTDSVTIRIEGEFAYGFFKNESGVHRLIRNSPYSADNTRHTSFAAVNVTADIEDTIEIEILDKDLDITAQRAGGPGGQNSNKVSSACRIKHLPTGINILSRTERDFHKNKSTALKILKSKLYDLENKKKQEITNQKLDAQSDIAFGHQVRTYTENPARTKDHRTEYEILNFSDVLNGNIQEFIMACLKQR